MYGICTVKAVQNTSSSYPSFEIRHKEDIGVPSSGKYKYGVPYGVTETCVRKYAEQAFYDVPFYDSQLMSSRNDY